MHIYYYICGDNVMNVNEIIYMNKQENFIKRAKDKFGDKFDYSKVEYINCDTKVCIICPKHGEFWQTPYKHLKGKHSCRECSKEYMGRGNKRYSQETLLIKFREIHGDRYDYDLSEFKTIKSKISITCKKHGEFKQTASDHLSGFGCPKCGIESNAEKSRSTRDEFIAKSKMIHGDLYDYSKVVYINSWTPVCITCKRHGDFLQRPSDHIRGHGCNKCGLKSQTKIFNNLSILFNDMLFEYSPDWLFPQRFDMYLEKYNIAIEYNGEQHYGPIKRFGGELGFQKCQQRDKLKREKCLQNDCKLFEIRYDHEEEDLQHIINEINKIIENYET